MSTIKCSLAYHYIAYSKVEDFAVGVRDGIYVTNIGTFPAPTVSQPIFQSAINAYVDKRGAYKNGGKAQKAAFNIAYETIMGYLDQLADYVDSIAIGNENIVLEGGFVPTKGTKSAKPAPVQPTGVIVKQVTTGKITAECDNQPYTDTYLCLLLAGAPLPPFVSVNEHGQIVAPPRQPDGSPSWSASKDVPYGPPVVIDLNKNRKKTFTGLVPGVEYYVVFVAINASGVSALSATVRILCV